MLPARQPTQWITSSSGLPSGRSTAGDGLISNVCGATRERGCPGLGTLTKARLRCASLFDEEGSLPMSGGSGR